ncbi:GEVED domain-containing protein [Lacinutrix iliipiscaria]|uniref:GEVED domain-containing protein n=1 Tax=Lacinutrix iliipiscaria TaxID=1230532 RepID=A0ABW5WTT2_9FLAO
MTIKTTYSFNKIIAFIAFLFCCSFIQAQERTCGMTEYMEEKMKDPEYVKIYQASQEKFKAQLAEQLSKTSSLSRRASSIIIPVAVHYPEANEADRVCLEALAQNQIDILNADYTATNSDIALWNSASSNYHGSNSGAANIYFCIATMNHPVGVDPDMVEGGPAVTIGYNFGGGGSTDATWGGYMNFLVKDIGGGLLGFSPLGGSITNGDSVTMNLGAFGSGSGCPGSGIVPGAPFNLGRTVTHELGHFYNLNHTFTGDCGGDDAITDTPNIDSENYGCPTPGSIDACVYDNALTMNYMDYTNDACMYMFTQGQASVVDAYIATIQPQFKPNVTECTIDPDFRITSDNASIYICPEYEAVYNLSYGTYSGFSEDTTLSVTGNPAGSTVTFSSNPVSAEGDLTMTIDDLDGASPGTYSLRITGTSTSVSHDTYITLNINNGVCPSTAHTEYATSTEGVVFNTLSNLNSGKPSGYSDYTAMSTEVEATETYNLSVRTNTDGNFLCTTRVWIDWNQNCSFDDPGELYELGDTQNVTNGLTANSPLPITVPADAVEGFTTMRVTTKYKPEGFPTSCENGHDAEVEDYSLNVMTSLSVGEEELNSFAVFPNPNNGAFTVSFKTSSDHPIDIKVYDIRGRNVFNNTYENTPTFNEIISLRNMQSGMYILNVTEGSKTVIKKMIIE